MKKTLMLTALIASVNVYAGSIDYLAQQDAEYFAHASMTGKIGTSGAFYNPAGTAFMEDGLYVKVNTQTVFKNYTMNTNTIDVSTGNPIKDSHNSDYPSVMVPSIQIVKKDGDRSYFLHGGIAAGGGSLKYNNGISAFEVIGEGIEKTFREKLPNTTVDYLGGSKVKGSSFYYNLNLGMAQKVNEKFSVAGGVRFIYATRALEGTGHYDLSIPNLGEATAGINGSHKVDVSIDSEREAYGIGWLVGFNYKPIEKLNIGFKYESEIKLDFEAKNGMNGLKVSSDRGIFDKGIYDKLTANPIVSEWLVDGYRNLPAMMSLGISYDVNDRLTLLTSGNYYFIEDANDSNAYAHYTNGYEASVGFDYKLNEQYTLMAGYQYTNTGANEDTYKDTDYALDAHMYSIGLKYTPNETRTYTIAYSYVDYVDGTSKEHGTRFEKEVHAIGLAAEFKL